MNVDEFATHIQSAKKIGNAYLPGYQFVFNRKAADDSSKANIVPGNNLNAAVWGVLIAASEADRARFFTPDDTLELVPLSCVGADGKTYPAEVFISTPHATNNYLLPYDWYKEKLVTFARWQQLPEEYVNQLDQMESKPDPDKKRRERRLKKFRK